MYNYSIIIPFRDKFDLLHIAVSSIPDRGDIQIILVYNGKEPFPKEEMPSCSNATITYLESSPVKGAGHARNIGLGSVKGDYILFLDADDYFTPDAFSCFDKYLQEENDIVFFTSTSVRLMTGEPSDRHTNHVRNVKTYLTSGNDELLRYRWEGPVCKMFRAEYVKSNNFLFEETRVSNDAWFSLMTGHHAKTIKADRATVYVITEGEAGQSLVKTKTPETIFTRYQVAVKINKFLKDVGHYNVRITLIGFIRIAYKEFGIKEAWRFLKYAIDNRINIL